MKINYKVLSIFIMCFILIGTVSAWSYESEKYYGDAYAYAEVVFTSPMCEGTQYAYNCLGSWYTDISHTGDKFYIGINKVAFPEGEVDGFSGLDSVSDGRYYLDVNGEVPYYLFCAWDRDDAPNGDWAWTSRCGGWLGNGNFNNYKNIECNSVSDCGIDDWSGSTTCVGDDVYQNFIEYSCSSYSCLKNEQSKLKKSCNDGCSNGECDIPIVITPVDIYGCTNMSASNYLDGATIDDGSCIFPIVDEPEFPYIIIFLILVLACIIIYIKIK